MTLRTIIVRSTLAWALVAGVLMGIIGLFAFDGLHSVSAQADTTAPTVSSVAISSDPDDDAESGVFLTGVYGIGDSIQVTVTFSEDVAVTGGPRLALDIGGTSKTAEYDSADGSAVVFKYTVAEGNSDTDGIAVGADRLTLNGGSIKDAADNPASLAYDALTAQTAHKVDGIRPRMTRFAFLNGTDGDHGFYTAGEELSIDAPWSETIRFSNNLEPTISVDFGGTAKTCTLVGYYGFLHFICPIQPGDYDADGPTVTAGEIQVGTGWLRDTAGNPAILTHPGLAADSEFKVDAILPYVTAIEITSSPKSSDGYAAGETIEVTVTFNETVTVPRIRRSDIPGYPKPKIEIDVGGQTRIADFNSTNANSVLFTYNVASGDQDSDGVSIDANKLSLNGGAIWDQARNTPLTPENDGILGLGVGAAVTHSSLDDDPSHKVSADIVTALTIGTPTISGAAQVGETLTADTSGIADSDGLMNATFSYQWLADDTAITGATSYTYTLMAADEGKAITVTVSFTDDAGNPETRTSAQTATVEARDNSPATGAPTIIGTAQVGETLAADTSGIADADGLTGAAFSYQWLSSRDTEIQGATDATYTLVPTDEGKTVKVRVTFTDDAGNEESLTSAATGEVAAARGGICDRTQQVQDAILKLLPDIDDCAVVTDADLSGVRGSYFSNIDRHIFFGVVGNTRTLKPGDFRGLSNVGHLTLATVELEELPTGVFDGLPSLETLGLGTNNLSELPEDLFDGLSKLHTLRVSSNDLDALPENVFDGLSNLEVLSLWGNNLTALPEDVFDGLSSLTTLWLSKNSLSELPADIFDGLSDLELLVLDDNDLSALPENVFDGLSNLDTISLEGNDLRTVPGGVFGDLSSLTGLDLRENSLDELPEDAFEGLSKLDGLNLTHNALRELPADLFDGLSSLEGLFLNNNKLSELPDSIFEGLSRLNRLSLLDNPGTPFTIMVELEGQGDSTFVVKADKGAPVDIGVTLSVQGGTIPQTEIAIDGGSLQSQPIAVSRTDEDGTQATISMQSAIFQGLAELRHGGIPTGGFQIGLGEPLVLGDAEAVNSPATGAPAISGTAQVSQTLTADASGIADADGLTNATFSYQWLSSRDTEIGGATSSTYTLQASDASKVVKVRVTFTDDAGNNETLTSAATAAVAAAPTPNSPATGAPTISGTAQVGETLTADTSGISDADGLTNVSFSYQWIRSDGSTDTNIAVQTTSKYTLVSADEGQTIKVRVSFTDDAGNQEMLTSAPTAAVAAPAQADSEDEPSELSYLTVVVTEDDSDPDNVFTTFTITWNDAEDCSASYNAYLDGVVGDPIHLGSAASEGEQIAASLTNVSAESIGFDAKLYCGTIGSGRLVDSLWIPEYSRSFDTVPISRAYLPKPGTYSTEPGLTVLTVSSGTLTPAFHSQTLNYTVPDVANADGRITLTTTTKADYYTVAFMPGSLYFYISLCSHGGQQTSLSYQDDTGDPLYPLTDADADTPGFQMELDEGENVFKIRVWPNCENGHLYKLTVTRAANAPANTPATGAPTISGTARVGETLTAATSGIADADGLTGATFSYQWLSSRDTEIQGATGAAYILVPGDAGKTIKVKVSFTDDEGNAETLTSAATGAVSPRPNSPATGTPAIIGTARVGETLTAATSGIEDADGLTNVSFSYQWLGSRDAEIQGATNATYTLVTADEGKTVKVRVGFTDDAGNEESVTSASTAAVSAKLPPPDNVRAVTQKSGAVQLTWEAPDDANVTGYRIERSRADENRGGQQRSVGSPKADHTLVEDTGSADTGYTDESAERGVEYEYRVSARNEAGTGEASEWVRAGPESASNAPATGSPTIIGMAQVGQTLTAGITGIADADGLSGESFTYQWVSNDGTTGTDIENATGSTYTLVAADQGRSVKVRVTFTDGGGNEETLTSAPTGPVLGDGPPGAPRNLAATAGNKEVTLSWAPPADNGNAPATGYRIEWRVDGKDYGKTIWGTARSTSYTTNDQANLANGVKYFFRVRAGNGSGNSQGPYGPSSGEVSATPTSGSAVDLGTPVLSDTETLHHGMVQLDWEDVEDAGWYVVQYYHVEDGEWLDLPAEGVDIAFHGSSAVVSNLHGLSWLRVGAASCAGASEWSQIEQLFGTNASDWEGVPVPEVAEGDEIEPCPVVLGTPVLSETEDLHHGMARLDWKDIEDAGWYVVQYYHVKGGEWLDLPAEGVDIAFHGSSAVVSNLHGLSWLRVGAASCAGASEWSQIEQLFGTNASDWEGVPVPEVAEGDEIEPCSEDVDTPENSPATGAPTITGTAQVGETLTADTSGIADANGLSNVQYEYQWLADDSDISGATNATYTLVAADEAKAIKVQVSFTDDAGNDESLTSAATNAVAAAPQTNSPATGAPSISGTAQVGGTLTADTAGIEDADGLTNISFTYQWMADDADISGATGSTYTLADSEEGKAIKVEVSFTDDAGNDESLTSEATDAVAAAEPSEPPAKPRNLSATASHDSVTLTWDDPGDDTITGYVILRRIPGDDPEGHFDVLVADTGTAATTYTDDTVSAETRYTYRIKAINEHGVSERSRWVHIDTPAPPVPDKPTGLEATASHGQVVLTWDDPDDDSITGYVILRRVRVNDHGGDFSVLVADTGSAAASYTDDTVAASTTYTYRIKAINGAGTSERSRWFHIDIPAAPVPDKPTGLSATATHDSVTLTWNDPSDSSITGYVILRRLPGVDAEGHFDELVADTGTAATTYTDSSVEAETRYTYRIKAINEHGTSERSRWYHIDTPAAP